MAYISNIFTYYPTKVVTNQDIVEGHPSWTPEKVFLKLGIRERRVAESDEYASDLAVKVVEKMTESGQSIEDIDYIIYCTQSPDYLIPTTACIIHEKLKFKKNVGAVDFNMGCSGYVYGLGLATGLVQSGQAANVLLITAETYSKFIAETDTSNRLLFGDAATCTIVSKEKKNAADLEIGKFVYGTDGTGWSKLKSERGGVKSFTAESSDNDALYMDGPEVLAFALREVPPLVRNLMSSNDITELEMVNHFVFHQANKLMLDLLEGKMGIQKGHSHREFENIANTVSNTIPIVLEKLLREKTVKANETVALVGFGVGFSWGGVILKS